MSEDSLEKLGFVVFGWLLGLLGPAIVDSIKKRKENALGRDALLSEVREVGCLLAIAAYGVHVSRGTYDRSLLEWLKSDLERHAVSEQFQAFIPNLRKLLALPDDALKMMAKFTAQKDGVGTVLQKYPVSLLDSRVSALWTFDTSFQRGLLSVRQNIHYLDEIVDRTRTLHDMTFTKLENGNYDRVVESIDQANVLYADRARYTVNLIRKFTSLNA